jgi:hypothetical protein
VAGDAVFRVTNPGALRQVVTPMTEFVAQQLMAAAIAMTPLETGALRGGWRVVPGRVRGAYLVENATPYGKYVEFGTSDNPAVHMLGIAAGMMRGRYATR